MREHIAIGVCLLIIIIVFSTIVFLMTRYDHEKAYQDCAYKWGLTLKNGGVVSKWNGPLPPADIAVICIKVLQKDKQLNQEKRMKALEDLREYSK